MLTIKFLFLDKTLSRLKLIPDRQEKFRADLVTGGDWRDTKTRKRHEIDFPVLLTQNIGMIPLPAGRHEAGLARYRAAIKTKFIISHCW